MYDRILFPTDGSEGASRAFDHVLDIAVTHGSTLHVLSVADTARDSVTQIGGDVVDVLERQGEQVVADAADRASERGIETVTEVLQGDPTKTIVDYAEVNNVDLVALSARGQRGLDRFLLGSTTNRVLRQSTVPVLVIPPRNDAIGYPYRNILLPTDGSDGSRAALSVAVDVTIADSAELHVLSVIEIASLGIEASIDWMDALEERATAIVEETTELAEKAGVETVLGAVETGGSISGVILSYVEDESIDLIVVGTHGRTGLERFLLGSVTERLVRTASVPLLTVRPPAQET